MFNFFVTNHLVAMNSSGFKPGDYWINQLVSITYGIYVSFDEVYEIGGVFLDISKAGHEDLIFKLKQNGISVKLLRLIKDFPSNRKQRAVLNGQCSSWMDVQAVVP